MADLKAQLEISADASGVETGVGKAKRSLADLGATAVAAGKQASDGIDSIGKGGEAASQRVDRATSSLIASIQRTTAVLEAGSKNNSKYFETLAAQRGIGTDVLKPYLDQLDAVAAKARTATAATQTFAKATTSLGATNFSKSLANVTTSLGATAFGATAGAAVGAAATIDSTSIKTAAHAMEEFGFQTAGAKRELLVLAHELSQGNFSRFGSSLLVLGERTGAASLLFSPLTLAIGAATAAVAGLSFIFYEGAAQSKAFADSLVITGNAAGQTEGAFNALAKSIADSTHSSTGNVREFQQALISTGEIGPAVFDKATQAAVLYGKATGQTADKVAQAFAQMSRAPSKFAAETNQSLNFITSAQFAAIKAFEDNGRAADAQGVIYDALNTRFSKLDSNLGTLERGLLSAKNVWKDFWDSALDIGRTDTVEDKLARIDRQLKAAATNRGIGIVNSEGGSEDVGLSKADQDALANQRNGLLREQGTLRAAAAAAAANAEINKGGIDAQGFVDGYLKRAKSVEVLNKTLDEAKRKFDAAALASTPVSAANQKLVLAQIRADFAPPKVRADKGAVTEKDLVNVDIALIKQQLDAVVGIYKDSESVLEATRQAGLLDERDYYAAKLAFIRLNESEQERALTRENATLQESIDSRRGTDRDRLEDQKQIQANEQKILDLRQRSVTQETLLGLSISTAANRTAQAFRDAEDAQKNYLNSLTLGQQRALAGFGLGNQERDRTSGRSQIQDKYDAELRANEKFKRDLEAQAGPDGINAFGADAQKKYDDELQRIKTFQSAALTSYDKYFTDLQKKQADAGLGAKEALQNYFDDSQKLGKQTEDLITKSLSGFEDALVEFSTTGKLSFKSLADSLIADLIRIQYRAALGAIVGQQTGQGSGSNGGTGLLGSLLGSLGSYFSGGNYSFNSGAGFSSGAGISGGRASGGPVSAGGLYRINEHGPELLQDAGGRQYLLPDTAGSVKASAPSAAPRTLVFNNTQNFGAGTTRQTTDQAAAQAGRAAARALGRGGA